MPLGSHFGDEGNARLYCLGKKLNGANLAPAIIGRNNILPLPSFTLLFSLLRTFCVPLLVKVRVSVTDEPGIPEYLFADGTFRDDSWPFHLRFL